MALTFCFERDYAHRNEWHGGYTQPSYDDEPEVSFSDSLDEPDLNDIAPVKKGLFDPDWGHGRFRRKSMTLRSYRDPRSVGGPERKCAVKKMLRRLHEKKLIFIRPAGMSRAYLMG